MEQADIDPDMSDFDINLNFDEKNDEKIINNDKTPSKKDETLSKKDEKLIKDDKIP